MQPTSELNFSTALYFLKEGKKLSRVAFKDTCYIMAQYPDINSKMTEPYLYMVKKSRIIPAEGEISPVDEVFPVDLSCESIFAEDWYVKE